MQEITWRSLEILRCMIGGHVWKVFKLEWIHRHSVIRRPVSTYSKLVIFPLNCLNNFPFLWGSHANYNSLVEHGAIFGLIKNLQDGVIYRRVILEIPEYESCFDFWNLELQIIVIVRNTFLDNFGPIGSYSPKIPKCH